MGSMDCYIISIWPFYQRLRQPAASLPLGLMLNKRSPNGFFSPGRCGSLKGWLYPGRSGGCLDFSSSRIGTGVSTIQSGSLPPVPITPSLHHSIRFTLYRVYKTCPMADIRQFFHLQALNSQPSTLNPFDGCIGRLIRYSFSSA